MKILTYKRLYQVGLRVLLYVKIETSQSFFVPKKRVLPDFSFYPYQIQSVWKQKTENRGISHAVIEKLSSTMGLHFALMGS